MVFFVFNRRDHAASRASNRSGVTVEELATEWPPDGCCNLPLFWIALVIAAPLFEEFLFRGFLFSGWLNTRLRATGTILLTSALWTLIHVQYDVVQLLVVFVYGIVLGLARYRTGSLIAPLVIHGAINMIALLQVTLLVWSAS